MARSGWTPSQKNAPRNARTAATYSALSQPKRWAISGVRVGERAPPRFPPMFMKPDTVPAWALARSMVAAQYAATVRNNSPSPKDKNNTDRYGSLTAAPAQINPAAPSGPLKPSPQRPMRLPNRRLQESDNQSPTR